ncbi:PD-(D/E)XK nuclease family protein [uncultured Microscilla sp.]|uniref:PD-(D/E)XK nuclease family protein n=1 Tax=uncultured Microscilla sp. TaxID=432653 RepID=UPI0026369C0F|nr:PD-(D/E)XK nuclease family protein [uncultured Microscilla sp.]
MKKKILGKSREQIRVEREIERIEREIEDFMISRFDQNYEILSLTYGRGLAEDVKDTALQQVWIYWQKMREVAKKVTETEVKLILPNQKTPEGRPFTIEGVVDIVREKDKTIMYDIKTHAAEDVKSNQEFYEKQLNVYAYIWQTLRSQQLDETAIIATSYPKALKEAIVAEDEDAQEEELAKWEPLIPIEFSQERVEQTIELFGKVVDCIEAGKFNPPSQSILRERDFYKRQFATRVCRNCDARFSCDAYLTYYKKQAEKSANQRINPIFEMIQQSQAIGDMQQAYWTDKNQPSADEEKSILDDD